VTFDDPWREFNEAEPTDRAGAYSALLCRRPRILCAAIEGRGSERGDSTVTRYVITPDVALRLAYDEAVILDEHQLLAPTLLRSQMLSLLYQAVRQGETTKKDADRQLNYVRALRIRLLGDRVLQNVAWKIADQLGWPDTLDAEYVALTALQGDAFITLDAELAHAVESVVTIAPIEALS
jgi:predicted nucleic acid-binding protein